MSVLSACTKVSAKSGTYAITVSSVNPTDQVSFQVGDQPYDSKRLEDFARISANGGTPQPTPKNTDIVAHPTDGEPTQWDQNPIKLVVQAITSDQGEYKGDSAVFYGYFLGKNASGLNFYLNQAQSQQGFKFGTAGVPAVIDQLAPAITVG
jgi:hypothetical protein